MLSILPGGLAPARGNAWPQRHAARETEFQACEVELGEARMVEKRVVECIHPRDEVRSH
jgi:hypothetical protein